MIGRAPDVLLVGDLASTHLRRLALALDRANLRVEAASFEGEPVNAVPIHRLAASGGGKVIRHATAVPVLARILRRRRPRLVHAHYISSHGLVSALAVGLLGRRIRPRLIQTAWGTDLLVTARASLVRRRLAQLALRRADAITADSAEVLEIASELAPRIPVHRFMFGPPEALLERSEERGPVIVSLRRLDPDMRVDLVVSAFREAQRSRPESLRGWRLIVAGEGVARDAVRAAAGDDSSVVMVGQLEPAALYDLLARARVAVTVPRSDATSAALLEALAAGLTVVANELPANGEWLDASTAELVPRDPTTGELSDAIVRAVGRPESQAAARAKVADATWEIQVARLIGLYEAVAPTGPVAD